MVKFLITYTNGDQFGIEVETVKALEMLKDWLNKEVYFIEVEGYGFYPSEVTKVELFDLV